MSAVKGSSTTGIPDELLTKAQQAELDRRLKVYRLNPEKGSSWEQVNATIRKETAVCTPSRGK
jgi:putative addiction module component (TIGR02574 family)